MQSMAALAAPCQLRDAQRCWHFSALAFAEPNARSCRLPDVTRPDLGLVYATLAEWDQD